MMAAKTPEEALSAVKQEIASIERNGGTGGGSGSKSDDELDLRGIGGGPQGGVTIDDGAMAALVEKGMAASNSDISSSSGNIFQILSNRYQRSAMRRLFGDNEPMEKANETDISR